MLYDDIKNIIFSEATVAVLEDSSIERVFYDFLSELKILISKTKEKELGKVKFKVLELMTKIKNNGIEGLNFENQLNDLIFSTSLNSVKVEESEVSLGEAYALLNKIFSIDFNIMSDNEYKLWCYLKMSRILKNIFEKSENNLISEKYKLNDINGMLKAVFKNSDGTSAELLTNYNGNVENGIYLTVRKTGNTPIYFVFIARETKTFFEEKKELQILRDGNLFSGVYRLYMNDVKDEEEINNVFRDNLGFISFSEMNTEVLSELISKISDYNYMVNHIRAVPAIKDRLKKFEIERRNVLVVTVKSKEQFEINLKNDFYYMPLSHANSVNFNYEYIAVYQSLNIFGGSSGILYYGEIENVQAVRRREIIEVPKDSDEIYLRFSVKWKMLKNKIEPDVAVKAFCETSFAIFSEAENVSEIFIRFYDEYETYKFLKENSENVKIYGNEYGLYAFKTDRIRLELSFTSAELYKDNEQKFSLSRMFFRKNTKAVLNKIKKEFMD